MKHGMAGTRVYQCWSDMKKRCYNPKNKRYSNYGARGISVCDDWLGKHGAENFIKWALANGYQDNLTLERIDVNGNYEPSNCCWATRTDQQNNRRCNHLLTYNGDTKTLRQWSEYTGISYSTLHKRIFTLHWDIERALTTR